MRYTKNQVLVGLTVSQRCKHVGQTFHCWHRHHAARGTSYSENFCSFMICINLNNFTREPLYQGFRAAHGAHLNGLITGDWLRLLWPIRRWIMHTLITQKVPQLTVQQVTYETVSTTFADASFTFLTILAAPSFSWLNRPNEDTDPDAGCCDDDDDDCVSWSSKYRCSAAAFWDGPTPTWNIPVTYQFNWQKVTTATKNSSSIITTIWSLNTIKTFNCTTASLQRDINVSVCR